MKYRTRFLALVAVLCVTPLAAKKPDRPKARATTYMATAVPNGAASEQVIARNKSLIDYELRPEKAVVLKEPLNAKLGKRMAMHRSTPLVSGTPLYGWRDWPGLYCDLMRNRGLGSSAICLRDNDKDGQFDDVVRLDFNSARGDVVFLTDKGKVRGGYFKKELPLEKPLAYEKVESDEAPVGRVSMLWDMEYPNKSNPNSGVVINVVLGDGSNFTGTEIFSENLVRIPWEGRPVTFDHFGARVTILELTKDRKLRYTVATESESKPIGFIFRGYTVNMIFIG